MTQRIAMFGASGPVGHVLRPGLVREGVAVLAISRLPHADRDGVQWLVGQLPEAVPELPPCDAIVSLGPLDHFTAWMERARPHGQPRIVAMSSMSALSKRGSPLAAERALSGRLREAETRLARTCDERGLGWCILRATLIYGVGRDRSFTPLAQRARRLRVFPLPAGSGLRQPVHAADLAAAVMAALGTDAAMGQVLEIGGGERLTSAQMFARVQRSLPFRTLPLHVPRMLLRLGARLVPRIRGMVERLDQDLVADNRELVARLGVHPRDFQP